MFNRKKYGIKGTCVVLLDIIGILWAIFNEAHGCKEVKHYSGHLLKGIFDKLQLILIGHMPFLD